MNTSQKLMINVAAQLAKKILIEPCSASKRRVFDTPSDEYRSKSKKANSKAKYEYSQYCWEKEQGNAEKAKEHYEQSQIMYGYSRKCDRRAKDLEGISWVEKRKMDAEKRKNK